MKELAKSFPEGVTYEIDYDPTVFVRSSIEAVVHTLFEAVLLVVLVVVVFLQSWRASVIPLVAVPVAIIGTLAALLLAGFSINSLTLFGLVLATGIVVDDAIVVVENIERKIEQGLNPHAAAHAAMGEVDPAHHFHCIGVVRCVRARRLRHGSHRPVLSPVRHHHCRKHHHFHVQLAHPVAGPGGFAVETQERGAGCLPTRDQQGVGPLLRFIQSRLRKCIRAIRSWSAAPDIDPRGGARHIRAAVDRHLRHVQPGAGRVHSGAGQTVSHRHRTTAGCRLAGSHRESRTPGVETGDGHARRRTCHRVLRPVGAGFRQSEQCGGAVLSAQTLR